MNMKEYSNAQERMISQYLGWDTVSASGARNFYPGDIRGDGWLGECKTHSSVCDNIVFKRTVWYKICEESKSAGWLHPALFVDNGTQTVEGTWVLFSVKDMYGGYIKLNPNDWDIQYDISIRKNLIVHHEMALFHYTNIHSIVSSSFRNNVYPIVAVGKFDIDNDVYICPLRSFKSILDWGIR